MKRVIFSLLALVALACANSDAMAQVPANTTPMYGNFQINGKLDVVDRVLIAANGSTASTKAALDIQSTTQGFLPPRMTAAQRAAISSPTTGLLVFDTDSAKPCFYNGSAWKCVRTY